MSRPKREWFPGAIYHVMSRGNRRLILFNDEDDYLSFLESVAITREMYPFKIHSLCLMTNHFHMEIETGDVTLSKIMSRMLHPYSVNFNRKYNYTGHLFESRYTACLIRDDRYFLEVSRYIHLNPVKARMVREPLSYEYSSYRLFVGDSVSDTEDRQSDGQRASTKVSEMIKGIVDTDRVLGCFRHNPREQYRMFVEGKISHAEQELLIQKEMKEDSMWLPWQEGQVGNNS